MKFILRITVHNAISRSGTKNEWWSIGAIKDSSGYWFGEKIKYKAFSENSDASRSWILSEPYYDIE